MTRFTAFIEKKKKKSNPVYKCSPQQTKSRAQQPQKRTSAIKLPIYVQYCRGRRNVLALISLSCKRFPWKGTLTPQQFHSLPLLLATAYPTEKKTYGNVGREYGAWWRRGTLKKSSGGNRGTGFLLDAVNTPVGDAFVGTVPMLTDDEAAGRIKERCINMQTKTIYIKRNKELVNSFGFALSTKAERDGGKKKKLVQHRYWVIEQRLRQAQQPDTRNAALSEMRRISTALAATAIRMPKHDGIDTARYGVDFSRRNLDLKLIRTASANEWREGQSPNQHHLRLHCTFHESRVDIN